MKKTIKNIFGLIFITIMLLSVSVANADNDFGISVFSAIASGDRRGWIDDNFSYWWNVPISEYDGPASFGVEKKGTVTELPDGEFPQFYDNNHGAPTEIYIGNGITRIGNNNFNGYNESCKDYPVIKIDIPDTVTSIGNYAFQNITFDQDYNDSYAGIEATQFTIPKSVKTIGTDAFKNFTAKDIYINKPKGSIAGEPWGYSGTIHWIGTAVDISNSSNSVSINSISNQNYTGSLIAPNIAVSCNDVELVKDTDYTVSYSNNKNVGTATISITGIGDYTGTITKNFNIVARDISDTTIGSIPNQTYTGNSISALPVITYNGATLTKGTDYTLTYSNNVNVGTGTVTITGKGNFKGTTSKTFSISARAMSDTSVANVSSQTYTGNGISPLPTITYNNKTLKKDTDYTLSYSNNINAGTATITITGKGNFTGMTSTTFIITQKSAEKLNISEIANQIYTGKEIKPNVVITDTER